MDVLKFYKYKNVVVKKKRLFKCDWKSSYAFVVLFKSTIAAVLNLKETKIRVEITFAF